VKASPGTSEGVADNKEVVGARLITVRAAGDAAVIARSRSEPEAFALIFDRHFKTIHRYLARRVGRDRADDLASQTFAVAFERRASFRPEAADARPWLYGIATNLLANDRRAEQRLLDTIGRMTLEADEGAVLAQDLEADCALASALAKLDPVQRDVLLLFAWAELSYEEIADSLGVPLGTVRSRLSRARGVLRAELARSSAETTCAGEEAS
jgi:RNA polymerase sigma factor (sigma-70 family)